MAVRACASASVIAATIAHSAIAASIRTAIGASVRTAIAAGVRAAIAASARAAITAGVRATITRVAGVAGATCIAARAIAGVPLRMVTRRMSLVGSMA